VGECRFSDTAQASRRQVQQLLPVLHRPQGPLARAQILGHNSTESLARPTSTGVASGPTHLFPKAF
jgi:hypothetical protein